jgi:hypothetical protein
MKKRLKDYPALRTPRSTLEYELSSFTTFLNTMKTMTQFLTKEEAVHTSRKMMK